VSFPHGLPRATAQQERWHLQVEIPLHRKAHTTLSAAFTGPRDAVEWVSAGILQSGSIVPRVLPFGWTFRDFLQSPKFIPMAGSIVGLLTVSSWVFGDASPFNVLSAVAHSLGIRIAGPLAHADTWLNAKPRHDGLAGATFLILFFATVRQAARLANRYLPERGDGGSVRRRTRSGH
jgi:hypothetical protein